MSVIKMISRVQRINDLIRRKATGSPEQFAEKLNLSESRLYEVLRELRLLGLSIRFSHLCNSYYYEDDIEIEINIKGRVLHKREMEDKNGGTNSIDYHNNNIADCIWNMSVINV